MYEVFFAGQKYLIKWWRKGHKPWCFNGKKWLFI